MIPALTIAATVRSPTSSDASSTRAPPIEHWFRSAVAGAHAAVLRVGRSAQLRLQARAGRHQPLPRRVQQPEPAVPAARGAGGDDGDRADLSGRAAAAAHPREPHAQPVLPAERRAAAHDPAPGRARRADRHARSRRSARRPRSRCPTTAPLAPGAARAQRRPARAGRLRSLHDPAQQRSVRRGARRSSRASTSSGCCRRCTPAGRCGASRTTSGATSGSRTSSRSCSAIDPWLINPYLARCGEVNFKEKSGEECLAANVEALLPLIRAKYLEYGIKEEPYVVVKADAGTYGMGIMMAKSPDDVRGLNRDAAQEDGGGEGGPRGARGDHPGRRAHLRDGERRGRRAGGLHDRPLRRSAASTACTRAAARTRT